MTRITVEAEVDVDVSDYVDELTDDELIDELESRGYELKTDDNDNITTSEFALYTNLYYALRDGTLEDAIKIINPTLDQIIGRQV